MKNSFIKPLTRKTFEDNKKFIDDYDKKENERATPLDNPLTGDALKKIAEKTKEDKLGRPLGPS